MARAQPRHPRLGNGHRGGGVGVVRAGRQPAGGPPDEPARRRDRPCRAAGHRGGRAGRGPPRRSVGLLWGGGRGPAHRLADAGAAGRRWPGRRRGGGCRVHHAVCDRCGDRRHGASRHAPRCGVRASRGARLSALRHHHACRPARATGLRLRCGRVSGSGDRGRRHLEASGIHRLRCRGGAGRRPAGGGVDHGSAGRHRDRHRLEF